MQLPLLRATQSASRKKLLDCSKRLLDTGAILTGKNSPPSACLRNHWRKRRLRRLPPTPRCNPAHGRFLQRRGGQPSGGFSPRSYFPVPPIPELHPHPLLRSAVAFPATEPHTSSTRKPSGRAVTISPQASTPSVFSSTTSAMPLLSPTPSSMSNLHPHPQHSASAASATTSFTTANPPCTTPTKPGRNASPSTEPS